MRILRFKFTGITLLLFILALYYEGVFVPTVSVSHETLLAEQHILVKQGVSQDGNIAVMRVSDVPQIPPRLKFGNHSRTLRAFIAPNRSGILTLYVESFAPITPYAVTGSFTVSSDYMTLAWSDNNTLAFFVVLHDGRLAMVHLSMNSLTATIDALDDGTVLPIAVNSVSLSD